MNYKKVNAENTTITRDLRDIDAKTGNLYESLTIIAKRSNQIAAEMKEELSSKLSEFASTSDNLEEIFEIVSKLKFQSITKDCLNLY
jgi:DNA anti-recombination protein RmuC